MTVHWEEPIPLLHSNIPHRTPCLSPDPLITIAKHPTRYVSCSVLGLCYQWGLWSMQENKSQYFLQDRKTGVAITHISQLWTWSSQETLKWLPLSHLSKVGIHKEPWLGVSLTVCLSLILARTCVTAALKGDDGNSVFEMRSHSIRNKPSVQQNSPAIWSTVTAFLFTCHSSAFLFLSPYTLFLHLPEQPKECQSRSWPQVVWS